MKYLLLSICILITAPVHAQSWRLGVQVGGLLNVPLTNQVLPRVQLVDRNGRPTGRYAELSSDYRYEGKARAGASISLIVDYAWRQRWQFGAELRGAYQPYVVREIYDPTSGTEQLVIPIGASVIDRRWAVSRRQLNPTDYHYQPMVLELPVQARYYLNEHWGFMLGAGPRLTLRRKTRIHYKNARLNNNSSVVIFSQYETVNEPYLKTLSWVSNAGVFYRLSAQNELSLQWGSTLGSIVDTRNVQEWGSYQEKPLTPTRVQLISLGLSATHWLK
ncbi:outer membrane beta-barrel protein [Hymenobacter latericus]|uniref:outer membrane beta-barrel protein n=1 Tax=Hymenobacter sp. YIM 151858-1 TaxID=2987688 RepID=UPI002225BCC3|nr:outer membrane beta-barrel protein [Hymenobacter sp. YIM 151858-1]UYZ60737.1 outer membrane beta-barrel protein [Hymenobacter sp. YIM 151858-1]